MTEPIDGTPELVVTPTWVRIKVKQRLAQLAEHFGTAVPTQAVVMMPLSEEGRDDTERWERTCDNCGTYVPVGTDRFYVSQLTEQWRGVQVIFVYGCCADCKGESLGPT